MEIKYFNPGDHVNPVKTVAFTYDKVGNLLTYNDGVTSGEYFYDNAYRKVSETVNYGSFTKTYDYTYLKNGLKETFTCYCPQYYHNFSRINDRKIRAFFGVLPN